MLARWLARTHERERQAWLEERRRLVETICHLADRPMPDDRRPVMPDVADEGDPDEILL